MSKNISVIRQSVRQMIQDEFTADLPYTWEDDELNQYIEDTLVDLSQVQPHETKVSVIADGTKKIDLSTITDFDIADLINVEKAEYPVDEEPESFRNVTRFGNELTICIDTAPTSGDNIYLYCLKVHTLNDSESTLNRILERVLILGSAGQAAINKATALYLQGAKVNSQIDSAVTAIEGITTILSRAVNDIANGRAASESISDMLADAQTTLDKVDAEVQQAITDLDAGRLLANTVTIGRGLSDYAQLVASGITNARGLLDEANGYFRQGQAEEGLISTQLGLASREIQAANAELGKAGGYLRIVSAKTGLAGVGRALENWGKAKQAEYKNELRRLRKVRMNIAYSRS